MKTFDNINVLLTSFENKFSYRGLQQTVSLELLYKAFKSKPIRTKETFEEYMNGDKSFKDKAKDKGAFIAGETKNNTRQAGDVINRNMITLDLDYCPANIFEIINEKVASKEIDFLFIIYSTHSHSIEKPRLRLLVPLEFAVPVEQYEPIALVVARKFGLEYFDATTFQPNRIMYFPSVAIDGDYFCEVYNLDETALDPDQTLESYMDYKNVEEWQRPHFVEGLKRENIEKGKGKDSTKLKPSVVGSFNLVFSIDEAIERFLPHIYKKEKTGRYTYINGESKGGLVILNNQYAFSHHGTDPAQGRKLHAFDIVRIHMFGLHDVEVNEQEVYEKYAHSTSFQKMREYVVNNIPEVVAHLPEFRNIHERREDFVEEVAKEEVTPIESNEWLSTLDYTGKDSERKPRSNARNIKIILENDPLMKGLFYYDAIKDAICFDRTPFWNSDVKKGDLVGDVDDSEMRVYFNSVYSIVGKDVIYDTVVHQANRKRRHPIKSFFAKLPDWDGIPRIETIINDLFDVKENVFTRQASKSWWCGMVNRILNPASKYDMLLLLSGSQGVGKSQWLKSIATLYWGEQGMPGIDIQPNFFSDDELPFDKKDAYEQLGGIWIFELPEFEKYYKRTDVSTIKSFITKTTDKFRKSYGKRVGEYKRQCVFAGTTNDTQPLRDRTGNRRFFPFYSRLPQFKSRVYDPMFWTEDIRNQCLAEALHYLTVEKYNPMSSFTPEALEIWQEVNEKATSDNESEPIVEMYVNNMFPIGFFKMNELDMKRFYHENETFIFGEKVNRERRYEFSIKEIFVVAFNQPLGKGIDFNTKQQIEQALSKLGYEKQNYRRTQGIFGQQYVYAKVDGLREENDDDLPF